MKGRLDATLARARQIQDAELAADHARYVCVLVSGFLEQSVIELLVEHARTTAGPRHLRFVDSRIRKTTNLNCQRILDLLGSFDTDWRATLAAFLVDERKAAVDSVVDLRNTIAHGRQTTLTIVRIADYYRLVTTVVERVADICVPVQGAI